MSKKLVREAFDVRANTVGWVVMVVPEDFAEDWTPLPQPSDRYFATAAEAMEELLGSGKSEDRPDSS